MPSDLIAASLSSLFPLSFQVFHVLIDGGDQFMVPLALGPSLFRSQHVGELGPQLAFFLPNEHGVNFRLSLYQRLSCAPSREAGDLVHKQKLRVVNHFRQDRLSQIAVHPRDER